MNPNPFAFRQVWQSAWPAFKNHVSLFVLIMLTFFAAWAALEMLVITGQSLGILFWIAAHLAFLVIFSGLQRGFLKICLALVDGRQAAYTDLFMPLRQGLNFFLLQLFYWGMSLFLLGVYFGVQYALAGFYMAEDDDVSVFDSLKASALLVDGVKLRLLGFLITNLLINVAGAALLGLGLILTLPLTTLMSAFLFRQLQAHPIET